MITDPLPCRVRFGDVRGKANKKETGYLPANQVKTEGNDLQERKILVSFTDSSSCAAGGEVRKNFSISMYTVTGRKR